MSKKELHEIKQEVKEKELAKLRWQWFKAYWDHMTTKAMRLAFLFVEPPRVASL